MLIPFDDQMVNKFKVGNGVKCLWVMLGKNNLVIFIKIA